MPSLVPVIAAAASGYVLGCIATGYYLVRWRRGQDLRTVGSGATGGRNVGRVLGPVGFLATAGVDLAKSVAAVAIPIWLGWGSVAVAAAMIGVTAGHVWPAQLGFRGGKGIAPFVGTMLVVAPLALALGAVAGGVLIVVTRRLNAGGLAGMTVAPVAALALGAPQAVAAGILGSLLIAIVAHRANFAGEVAAPSFAPSRLVPFGRLVSRAGRSDG
jgi:glycerol-3-phosphate acyltransferase PlsY